MTFTARIAHWNNGLTVYPLDDLCAHMRVHRWSATLTSDRCIELRASEDGSLARYARPDREAGCEWRFNWNPWNGGPILPHFCIGDLELVLAEHGEAVQWKVPPDHELPWLSRRPTGKADVAETVRINLGLRVKSCRASGADMDTLARAVPSWARGVLPGEEWMNIMNGRTVQCT